MRPPDLAPIARLAGYVLSDAELEEVATILSAMLEDLRELRELDLPDDIEPVLAFRVEPWTSA